MCKITHTRSAALAGVARLIVAARRHGQATIAVQELEAVLAGVDIESLVNPRPCEVGAPRSRAARVCAILAE